MAFSLFGKKTAPPPGKAPAPQQTGRENDTLSLDGAPGQGGPIEVQEASQMPAVVEQAAMLYSIEQPESACEVLEAAVGTEDLGGFEARAWGMLFELYELLGRRQDFERVAIAYAARFETSPPTWAGTAGPEEKAVAPKPSQAGKSLAGLLGAGAEAVLKPLLPLAEKNLGVRLDLTRVTDADDAGCAALNELLGAMRKARSQCLLAGADKLAAILGGKLVVGGREHEQAWLLLLNLYQHLGAQDAFEEAAVNYAVTFEVSPPSWEPFLVAAEKAADAAAGQPSPEPEAETESETESETWCVLEGSITSAAPSPFASIRTRAESSNDVTVDVGRLRRMDFVAATNLMNLATSLLAAQKRLRLVKASHLVTALWEVIGLNRVAVIVTRR